MDGTERETFSIAEAATRSGVSAHTLRYYERVGLLGRIPRARSGHRRFGDEEVRWIGFLRKMQATGMPIRSMRAYAELVRRGEGTEAARMALLVEHEARVVGRVSELKRNLEMIRKKIAHYGGVVKGRKLPARAKP
jgi:DNA-binding transcriptional MerR regulator